MKQLNDIVLTGFLALLAFTACTEEKLIDERPMETGTVSISFSTEGVETKAIRKRRERQDRSLKGRII